MSNNSQQHCYFTQKLSIILFTQRVLMHMQNMNLVSVLLQIIRAGSSKLADIDMI